MRTIFSYGVRGHDKLLSSDPANQLNSKVSCIRVAFLNQFIHWVFKIPEQVCPISWLKDPRDKSGPQGVKLNHTFHYRRCLVKDVWVDVWGKWGSKSLTIRVFGWLRWESSLFSNRGWWIISYNIFAFRGSTRHLQESRYTAKNQKQHHKG